MTETSPPRRRRLLTSRGVIVARNTINAWTREDIRRFMREGMALAKLLGMPARPMQTRHYVRVVLGLDR